MGLLMNSSEFRLGIMRKFNISFKDVDYILDSLFLRNHCAVDIRVKSTVCRLELSTIENISGILYEFRLYEKSTGNARGKYAFLVQ